MMAKTDDYPITDPKKDPRLNDDSQPSITNPTQALRAANERAGVTEPEVAIPAPADAIDLAYRTAVADVDAQEVGKAVAEGQKSGVPDEAIDVEALGEGEEDPEDVGTGAYEGRTLEQLRSAARSKGLAVSGSKDDLVARLRG
jgi:hypothetical protein